MKIVSSEMVASAIREAGFLTFHLPDVPTTGYSADEEAEGTSKLAYALNKSQKPVAICHRSINDVVSYHERKLRIARGRVVVG